MKNADVQSLLVRSGSVVAIALGLAGAALAGPGPQYWQQQAARAKARSDVGQMRGEVAANPAHAAMPCTYCRTGPRQVSAFYNVSGKIAPRTVVVGTVHSCDGCRRVVVQGAAGAKDEMKRDCPLCAKAGAECCPTSG